MSWVDLVIILVLAYFAYTGYRYGFIAGVLELVGIVISIAVPLLLYSPGGRLLEKLGVSVVYAGALAFLIIWFITLNLYFFTVRRFYRRLPAEVRQSPLNLVLGTLTGLIRGIIVVAVVLSVLTVLPISRTIQTGIEDSALASPMLTATTTVTARAADIFGEAGQRALGFLTIEPKTNETVTLHFRVKNPEIDSDAENKMLQLVNQERTSRGLKPLTMDLSIQKVAREHSIDMLKRGYFSHNTLEGVTPFKRMQKGGVRFVTAGENIAFAPTVNTAHSGLMRSPGHRENILRPAFTRIGIGAAKGGRYGLMFTQDFAN